MSDYLIHTSTVTLPLERLDALRDEIADLKSTIKKKDDEIKEKEEILNETPEVRIIIERYTPATRQYSNGWAKTPFIEKDECINYVQYRKLDDVIDHIKADLEEELKVTFKKELEVDTSLKFDILSARWEESLNENESLRNKISTLENEIDAYKRVASLNQTPTSKKGFLNRLFNV
jgi:predicted  nucleic acid-binding Zn-ribbon protein